jgi:hypothetical protein
MRTRHLRPRRLPTLLIALGVGLTVGAPGASAAPGWTIVPSPSPTPGTDLNGVAVLGATSAWSVGQTQRYSSHDDMAILRWDGTAWSLAAAPNSRCYDEGLNDVAFTSASNGWAVGETPVSVHRPSTCFDPPRRGPLAVHWNGSTWTVVPTPVPTTGRGILYGVAAAAPNDVWAVGRTSYQTPLISHFDGVAWRTVPAPAQSAADLKDVAVVSARDVWAVGDAIANPDGTSSPLILRFDGTAWRRVASPAGPGYRTLDSVAAVGPSDVWAVGVKNPGTTPRPFAVHFDGVRWQEASLPALPAGMIGRLAGVTVTSASEIWAVGAQRQNSDLANDRTLTMRFDGARWSIVPSPNRDLSTGNRLNAVGVDRSSGETWAVGEWGFSVPATLTMRYARQ